MGRTRHRWRAAVSRTLLSSRARQNAGGDGGEDAAGAVGERDLGILDLARPALAAQLTRRLRQQEQAVHAGVAVGEPAAIGVEREGAARRGALPGAEAAAVAAAPEAQRRHR